MFFCGRRRASPKTRPSLKPRRMGLAFTIARYYLRAQHRTALMLGYFHNERAPRFKREFGPSQRCFDPSCLYAPGWIAEGYSGRIHIVERNVNCRIHLSLE